MPATQDQLPDDTEAELLIRFRYHPPHDDQIDRYQQIRALALVLAQEIAHSVPDCRERALAFTNLEQTVFWANAGIARRELDD